MIIYDYGKCDNVNRAANWPIFEKHNSEKSKWEVTQLRDFVAGDAIRIFSCENRFSSVESGNNVWIAKVNPYIDFTRNVWCIETTFE